MKPLCGSDCLSGNLSVRETTTTTTTTTTHMNDVHLHAVDAHRLQVGVQPLVELCGALWPHQPHTVVHDFVHRQVLHRHLQTRGQPRLHHLGRWQPRRPRPQPSPVATQRVPHVHVLHAPEGGLQVPHERPHAGVGGGVVHLALVVSELVVLLEPDQPAGHLLSRGRPIHAFLIRGVVVVGDGLPAVVDEDEPRGATALCQALHPLPHALRVHLQVEGVPGTPPELVDDARWRLLLQELESAQVGPDHPHGVLDEREGVVSSVHVEGAPELGTPHPRGPALHAQVHVFLLPRLEGRPEGPLDEGEEEHIGTTGLSGVVEHQDLGLVLHVAAPVAHPLGCPPHLEPEDAHEPNA